MSRLVGKSSDSNVASKLGTVNKQQILILYNLYLFRFLSTKHLQFILGKKQVQQVQQRLNLLLTRKWIGRNFSSTDRLTGKYASYYLLPKGMKALKQYQPRLGFKPELEPKIFHAIYKDKTASQRFINHCLGMADIYSDLIRIYGSTLEFFNKSSLINDDYFPEQRPDAYLRLTDNAKAKPIQTEYLLEYCEEIVPFWVYRNRIAQYIEYEDEDTWQNATSRPFPKILLITETPALKRRLLRFIKRIAGQIWTDDLRFYVSNMEILATAQSDDGIWSEYDEGDEVMVLRSLLKL